MRIALKALAAYPWYRRPFFWHQRRKYGRVLDAALLWARSPKLFLGVAAPYGALDRAASPLQPALRSLVLMACVMFSLILSAISIHPGRNHGWIFQLSRAVAVVEKPPARGRENQVAPLQRDARTDISQRSKPSGSLLVCGGER